MHLHTIGGSLPDLRKLEHKVGRAAFATTITSFQMYMSVPLMIELPDGVEGEYGTSGGRPRRITRRVLLVALLVLAAGAVAPFAWNYLQSYESTDDAQVDGHIDPLSSRIDGTVVSVHPEDDDRVKQGELLVEIDPRDYEVAVEQAKARLGLSLAQVASAKQDYAAALANVREAD